MSEIPIEALDLPCRIFNTLQLNAIRSIGDILQSWHKMAWLADIGPVTREQIRKAIEPFQIALHSAQEGSAPPNAPAQERALVRKTIFQLKLPERAYGLLVRREIYTIDQITATRLEEFRSSGVLNRREILDMKRAIHTWLGQDPSREEAYVHLLREEAIPARSEGQDFEELLGCILESLGARRAAVLEMRYGLKTGEPISLATIAGNWSLTSQRISQIEHEALERLRHPSRLRDLRESIVLVKTGEEIEKRGGMISEACLVEELQAQLKFRTYSMRGVVCLLRKLLEKTALSVREADLVYIPEVGAWTMQPPPAHA